MKETGKVVVLCGGYSSEREISLQSGAAVSQALREEGFTVSTLDPAAPDFIRKIFTVEKNSVVFIALHGIGGEDGTIQGFLETVGLPYTGSGVTASALSLNKILAKHLFLSAGVPTPPFCPPWIFPLVVKPACGGSTLGTTIVRTESELNPALQKARKYGPAVLAERFIAGREITVSILEGEKPTKSTILPSIEIVPPEGFYDFQAKYTAGASQHFIPPRLPSDWVRRAEKAALAAHTVLGCRGFSRSEVIITPEGDPYLLEVNTIPGFTTISLFPEAAAAAGISFNELVKKLVALARQKQ